MYPGMFQLWVRTVNIDFEQFSLYSILVLDFQEPVTKCLISNCKMKAVEKIDAMIATLQAAKDAAVMFDGGMLNSPGTKLRNMAGELRDELGAFRKEILAARNEKKALKAPKIAEAE